MEKEAITLTADAVRAIAEQISQHLATSMRHASPWLTPEEAAAYLCLKRRGLEDMRARGAGPRFHKVNDRLVRYNVRDLDAWLLSHGGGHD